MILLRQHLGIVDIYLDYPRRSWSLRPGQTFIPQNGNVTCGSEEVASRILAGDPILRLLKFCITDNTNTSAGPSPWTLGRTKGHAMNASLGLVRPAMACN